MILHETPLADARMIEPTLQADERGHQVLFWSTEEAEAQGIEFRRAAVIAYRCDRSGTLRGMHYQHPESDAKLVRVTRGSVIQAIVDLRPESATFCRSFCVRLDATRGIALYVPKGFAQGFLTLQDDTELQLELSEPQQPEQQRGFRFDDPRFSIGWPDGEKLLCPSDLEWGEFRPEDLGR